MAFTNQTTFDSGGSGTTTIREELADIIAVMTPMDTPLHNLLEQVPVRNTSFEWMVDEIVQPTSVQVTAEGEISAHTDVNRTRLINYVHKWTARMDVSDTLRSVDEAAVDDEFSYQIVKKGLEVLKQQEHNMHHSEWSSTGGSESAGWQTAGLLNWGIVSGNGRNTTPTSTSDAVGDDVAGRLVPVKYSSHLYQGEASGTGDFTETVFRDNILQPSWRNGMELSSAIGLCGGNVKQIISDFGVVYTSGSSIVNSMFIEAEKKKKVMTVDVYESDYGPLSIALDRYLDNSAVTGSMAITEGSTGGGASISYQADQVFALIEPSYAQLAVLRPVQYSPLAKTEDATPGYVVSEEGFRLLNPIAVTLGIGLI